MMCRCRLYGVQCGERRANRRTDCSDEKLNRPRSFARHKIVPTPKKKQIVQVLQLEEDAVPTPRKIIAVRVIQPEAGARGKALVLCPPDRAQESRSSPAHRTATASVVYCHQVAFQNG